MAIARPAAASSSSLAPPLLAINGCSSPCPAPSRHPPLLPETPTPHIVTALFRRLSEQLAAACPPSIGSRLPPPSYSPESQAELDFREPAKTFPAVPSATPRQHPRPPSPSSCATHRERPRQHEDRNPPPDTPLQYISPVHDRRHFGALSLPSGAHFWHKAQDGLRWLGKIAKLLASGDRYIVLALVPLQQLQLNSNSASPPELLGLLVILVPPRGLPLVNHRAPCGSDLF